VFGISFTEILLIVAVTIVIVGPQKLPGMLGTVGSYIGKLRRMATEMRRQTGIDDILRQEGLSGGLNELRSMVRGDQYGTAGARRGGVAHDPYGDDVEFDRSREYPTEGPDAYGAIPEDLLDDAYGEPDGASQSEAQTEAASVHDTSGTSSSKATA
jgi:sec-independent protein translocase protein TatB